MWTPSKTKSVILEWWHVASLGLALLFELWRAAIQPLLVEIAKGLAEIVKGWKGF